MKVAVITPYYKEPDKKLERCMRSVAAQDYPVTHYMVADGYASPVAMEADVKHIILPDAHGDNGNTPRGIGAISALNQGFEAFAFLDADNWFEPNHVSSLVAAIGQSRAHVALSGRKIVLVDGTPVPGRDPEDISGEHFDTSAFFITNKAAFLLPMWAMMDQPTSSCCDRVMFAAIKHLKVPYVATGLDTMVFESNYGIHYRMAGRPLPPKVNDIDMPKVLARQSRERMMARMRMSFMVTPNIETRPSTAARPHPKSD
jgi:hypothetical protein